MNTARLITHTPSPGAWNMAVDEALLQSAAVTGTITLRVYGWSEPTLSLGYFQPYRDREYHAPSRPCVVVRRATGGGAIVHDHEVTYSLTAPTDGRLKRRLDDWYRLVHETWIRTLAELGIAAHRCLQTDPQKEQQFLCFHRRSAGDLLLGSAKIGGSAQRRHAQAVLQHGSLILKRSVAAPELAGIAELSGRDLSDRAWLDGWVSSLGQALNVCWQSGELTDEETRRAEELERTKFGHLRWTQRR
ncbi:MAG: lipoate--protein ligase family protein [Planctomycetaceae bacterium]|nr:lipoate--protein ligase family protein [Planctomycetaceae bacterium]